MDVNGVIDALRQKRKLFHSEADFQFSMAWEIKCYYPEAEIRLEIPSGTTVKGRVDILALLHGKVYPIELKYLRKSLKCTVDNERFNLANGAHDLDMHDCIKDIMRIEIFSEEMEGFDRGYALWLTNDSAYWKKEYSSSYYKEFHAPDGIVESGTKRYLEDSYQLSILKNKRYNAPLQIKNSYCFKWEQYSNLEIPKGNGLFQYALICVEK